MKIDIDMVSCRKCGVYLNKELILKTILTLSRKKPFSEETKERYFIHIDGFTCPCCKSIHFISENLYDIRRASEEDRSYIPPYSYFDEKEYLCFKLGIKKTYDLFGIEGEN